MPFQQQVAVADIVKALLATNRRLIMKEETHRLVNEAFNQAKVRDQVLDQNLTQTYESISPDPGMTSSRRSAKRQKTDSTTASRDPGFLPLATSSADDEADENIRCVCESDLDNGAPWICCEKCSVWQHMNCMRLPWTTEEAGKRRYLCEKCEPGQHQQILTMLKEGTWDPLPLKSIEDDMDAGEDASIKINKDNHFQQAVRETRPEAKLRVTSPGSQSITSQVIALQQRLQHANSTGNGFPVSNLVEDIRKPESVPIIGPFERQEGGPLPGWAARHHYGHNNCEVAAKTPAVHGRNSSTASSDPTRPGAGDGLNMIRAHFRRYSSNGSVAADILLPANERGRIENKQKGRAEEPDTSSSLEKGKEVDQEKTPPSDDPTNQQLDCQAARKKSG